MRISALAMESGNVFNLQDFEENETKLKQRRFKDSIGTLFRLFDADLLLIWINIYSDFIIKCFFHLVTDKILLNARGL